MLTIGKLAAGPGAGRYYVDQVALGREDYYYAGEGKAPGTWLGSGGASLGLSGEVGEEGIVRLLDARDPATGERLREPAPSDAVAGFDLTFRAPKSVGILFGIAEPEVVREITEAHDAAVEQAMAFLEREACRARRGGGGAIVVEGRGFVAAAFRHRSSRAGDPLLHTHVAVANATQGADDRWTALHGQMLFRHAKTAGYLYQAALRAELSERLHVRWNAVEHGTADVAGISRHVIEHFSQRRAEILDHMAARGEHSARGADRDARDAPPQGIRRLGGPAPCRVASPCGRARPRPIPTSPGAPAGTSADGRRVPARRAGVAATRRARGTHAGPVALLAPRRRPGVRRSRARRGLRR